MTATTQAHRPLPKQAQAYRYLKDEKTRFVGFGGGAGGGKSWLGSEWLMLLCYHLPDSRWFIARNNMKDTRESVAITWGKVARMHGFTDYRLHDGGISVGTTQPGVRSEIIFLDATFYPYKDPLFERYGSKEFTGGWIEEAGEVHFGAFDVLKSRIGRHNNAIYGVSPKMLLTFNPKKNWLYTEFYKPWKENRLPTDTAFVQSLVTDNPHQTPEYIQSLQSIRSKATRERLLYGNWEYDDSPDALIDYDAILDAFNNDHVQPDQSHKYITADIAAQGSDFFRVGVWYGMVLVDHLSMDKSGGAEVIEAINRMRVKHGVRPGNVVYDSDGVGSFVGGKGGFIVNAKPFLNGSSPVGDEDRGFQNLKTQCYYYLADRINAGQVYLKAITEPTARDQVREELEQVKSYDNDKDGKLKILPKDHVKANIGRSPDWSDMLMMRMYFELPHKKLPGML
jgi:hypothetical protein